MKSKRVAHRRWGNQESGSISQTSPLSETQKQEIISRVQYGDHYKFYTNWKYNSICDKIDQFAVEVGPDPYSRPLNFGPLLDFAIEHNLTESTMDHIYTEYVYNQLHAHEFGYYNKTEDEELILLAKEFVLVG